MNEEQIRQMIQDEIEKAFRIQADRIITQKDMQILNGRNIQLGRTNGTMIGTGADQKLGFLGATPIIRQAAVSAPSGGGGGATDAVDNSGRIAINAIIARLKNIGITN